MGVSGHLAPAPCRGGYEAAREARGVVGDTDWEVLALAKEFIPYP